VAALPELGETLLGKYLLCRHLGEGGMSTVFEAEHLRLRQRVAIKFLRPEHASAVEMAQRFEREAHNAARLQGPHIARILDVDQTAAGLPFIVYEFLEGRDLAHELRMRGPLPVRETVDYLIQACLGLAEAHSLGIVHRDIKPANLFLAKQRTGRIIKVLDFGISTSAPTLLTKGNDREVTQTGELVGSPNYMSPEQAKSARDVGAQSDIWSLGVVCYRVLTKKYPFEGDGLTAVVLAIVSREPTPLAQVRQEVPPGLSDAVAKALAKDRNTRYETVEQFALALAPYSSMPKGALEATTASLAMSTSGRYPSTPAPAAAEIPIEEPVSDTYVPQSEPDKTHGTWSRQQREQEQEEKLARNRRSRARTIVLVTLGAVALVVPLLAIVAGRLDRGNERPSAVSAGSRTTPGAREIPAAPATSSEDIAISPPLSTETTSPTEPGRPPPGSMRSTKRPFLAPPKVPPATSPVTPKPPPPKPGPPNPPTYL